MSKFTIEAYSLPLIGGTASHNFWVLRDSDGNVAAELHGLATNRETGQPEAIGSSEKAYSLSIWGRLRKRKIKHVKPIADARY